MHAEGVFHVFSLHGYTKHILSHNNDMDTKHTVQVPPFSHSEQGKAQRCHWSRKPFQWPIRLMLACKCTADSIKATMPVFEQSNCPPSERSVWRKNGVCRYPEQTQTEDQRENISQYCLHCLIDSWCKYKNRIAVSFCHERCKLDGLKKNLKIPQIIMLTIYYSYVSYLLSRCLIIEQWLLLRLQQ